MCVIFLAINQHHEYKFIVGANRDEFYERPTAAADFWLDHPDLLAGKDLAHGGTWLGITRNLRFAAVTNFRNPEQKKGSISRGNLVKDFLIGESAPQAYLQSLQANKCDYAGFNLLVGDLATGIDVAHYSNVSDEISVLNSGIFGLSNHLLDTGWHKVANGKLAFENALANISSEKLFEILADKTLANDELLPDTGIGIDRERILSPIFIETPIYGTRSSSVLLIDHCNRVSFSERVFQGNPAVFKESNFQFQ